MTTTFILIRHGETIWNRERKLMGVTDIPLNAEGKRQVNKLSIHLRTYPFDVIFSSPLTRAIQTARAIHRFHKRIPLEVNENLRERNFGDVEGEEYEKVNERYPELVYTQSWQYQFFRPSGGESLDDLMKRADAFISSVLPSCEGKKLVVVSHGTILRVLICRFLSMSLTEYSQLHIHNTGLTILEHSKERGAIIHAANYTAHLPDLVKTD